MAIPTHSAGRWTRFAASAELALFYIDASALVKLVREEPESPALRRFLSDADLLSCELVLTELPRAIIRASAIDPRFPFAQLLERAGELLESLALLPLDRRELTVLLYPRPYPPSVVGILQEKLLLLQKRNDLPTTVECRVRTDPRDCRECQRFKSTHL